MNAVFVVVFLLFVIFRWRLLERVLGTVNMYLFDAIFWTAIAAWTFASPGRGLLMFVNFVCGALDLLFAVTAARHYVALSNLAEKVKNENKTPSGPNTPPASGS